MSTGTQYLLYLYEKIEPNFSIRAAIVNSLSVGLERSGSAVRLPNKTPEKTPPVNNVTSDPPTMLMNFRLLQGRIKFCPGALLILDAHLSSSALVEN